MHDPRKPPETEDGELFFSSRYTRKQAENYFHKPHESLSRRLSNWREQQNARKALQIAGNPKSVLDLPCGTGRFWELLAEDPHRELLAADYSEDMLEVAKEYRPPGLVARFRIFQASAFDIDLPDEAVDNIFCMRLLHHIGESEDRLRIFREFHRVTRDTVCLSLWVDGNYMGWKRRRLEEARASGKVPYKRRYLDRFVRSRRELEQEFDDCGFDIIGKVDFLPGWSMWRTYVLRKRR